MEFVAHYWLEIMFGAVVSLGTYICKKLYKKIKNETEEQKILKAGVVALLHDRLYERCRECVAKQECTLDDRSNLEYIYEPYKALGGNGTGTELYNRCKDLPYDSVGDHQI